MTRTLLCAGAAAAALVAGAGHAQPAGTPAAAPDGVPPAAAAVPTPEAAGVAPAAPDTAATPPAAADANGDIVVTAQFREQRLQTTPLSITAVNAAMLDARSQTNVTQVSNQAPNVTLRANNAAFGSSMIAYIRGIGQDDFNFALEPGVGIYVDDVFYSTLTGTVLDLLDLDRVEILRGPQGTLAGRNSIGGAIKLYSKKPSEGTSGFVEGTVGSFKRIDFRGAVNFTLVPERLFMRMSGFAQHYDGYVDRIDYACANPGSGLPTFANGGGCKLGTQGGRAVAAGRAALRWIATDDVEVNLAADYTHDNSEAGAGVVTDIYASNPITLNGVPYDRRFLPPNGYTTYATFIDPRQATAQTPWYPFVAEPINHYRGFGTSGTIDWRLGDRLTLKSITGYRWYRNDFVEDSDGSPLGVQMVFNHAKNWQFTQELRLNASVGQLIDYTVGGFYLKQRSRGAARVDLPYAGIDFNQDDPTPASSIAGFVQATAHLTPRLDLIGGYRFTHDEKDYFFRRFNPDGSAIQPINPVTGFVPPNGFLFGLDGLVGRYKKNRSDFRANLTYRWTDAFMTYAQFATGYKGGGVNPRPYFPSQVVPIAPETLNAYEVGFKSDFLDRKVRLNMSAFYNEYNDIQLTTVRCDAISPFPGAPCFAPLNVGSAHIKGVEAETTIRPVAGLLIDGSASYLDFDYTDIDANTGVVKGNRSPYTPKWKWSFGAQYEVPIGDTLTLTPRVDGSYQSTTFALAANSPLNRLPAYTLFNARLTLASATGGWSAALEVTNFTDKYHILSKQVPSGPGYVNGQPGFPRRFAVQVRKRF